MISLTTRQDRAIQSGHYRTAHRVQVKDASDAWTDLSALFGWNLIDTMDWGGDIDAMVTDANIRLWRDVYNLHLSPLVDGSRANQGGPLLDLARDVKIESAIVPDEAELKSADWTEVWRGSIDDIDWPGQISEPHITLMCRDLMARIEDTFIRVERDYGGNSDLLEDVLQDLLDDTLGDVTLYALQSNGSFAAATSNPVSSWAVPAYTQARTYLHDAMRRLVMQRAARVDYLNDGGTWRLTLWIPDREKTTPDRTFSDYISPERLRISRVPIRTQVRIVWTDADGARSDFDYPEIGYVTLATGTTLTDSSKSWTVDQFAGDPVRIWEGTGVGQERTIDSNTADELTVTSAWDTNPDTTSRFAVVDDGDSATPLEDFGLKFMELAEEGNEQLDTETEAKRMGKGAYQDVSAVKAEMEVPVLYFPFVELADLYRFEANEDLFDTDQDLAVVSYRHRAGGEEDRTRLVVRGTPAGHYKQWHRRETRAGIAPPNFTPSAPANLALVTDLEVNGQDTWSFIDTSWDQTLRGNVDYYRLRWREDPSGTPSNWHYATIKPQDDADFQAPNHRIAPVPGSEEIGVQVSVVLRNGRSSSWSAEVTVTSAADETAPATPTGLVATIGTAKVISLSWNDNTEDDLQDYGVYRHTSNVFGNATLIARARASRFVDTKVTYGQEYYYWVTAFDTSENESGESTSDNATPIRTQTDDIDPTTPAAPQNLALSSDSTDGNVIIEASWNTVSGAESYEVQFKRAATSLWHSGYTSSTTTILGPVQAEKLHEVRVRAITERRNVLGAFSTTEEVTTATDEDALTPADTLVPAGDLFPS